MVRRSSRAVPTYSELFSIASVVNLPKLYCVWMVMLHLEEYPKPYLDQVYGGRVIHFSTRQNLAAAERVLPRLHVYHI